jgi:hypothetical protein
MVDLDIRAVRMAQRNVRANDIENASVVLDHTLSRFSNPGVLPALFCRGDGDAHAGDGLHRAGSRPDGRQDGYPGSAPSPENRFAPAAFSSPGGL